LKFFNVISICDARKLLAENFPYSRGASETVPIESAYGRICAEDTACGEDIPAFTRSTVDGYAVTSMDTHGASESVPAMLYVKGTIAMGETPGFSLISGEAARISTGGMLPQGSDSVVMVENTETFSEQDLMVYHPVRQNENTIIKGDDIKNGEIIVHEGEEISHGHIGALASAGISTIAVRKKTSFSIISTGDEIVSIDSSPSTGQVRDINSHCLASMIRSIGGHVNSSRLLKDNLTDIKTELESAVINSDIVILSGGSSVGSRDFTVEAINSLSGEGVLTHGISIKPGKPTIIGESNGKAIFGLPGHPVASMIVFRVLVEYLFNHLNGTDRSHDHISAVSGTNIHSDPGKTTFQPVILKTLPNGETVAEPVYGKSGMISTILRAQGFIEIGSETEGINRGDHIKVYRL